MLPVWPRVRVTVQTLALMALLIACQTPHTASSEAEHAQKVEFLPILQGATDQDSTVLSLMVPITSNYEYRITLEKSVLVTPKPKVTTPPGLPWKIVNITLENLSPGLEYSLEVLDGDRTIDARKFKTLDKKLKSPKIAIVSCTDDAFAEVQKKQWDAVARVQPDMIFMIGDNVYVDKSLLAPTTELDLWRRYQETRLRLDFYRWKTLVPVYATWDDHDYGTRDANRRFPLKDTSRQVFRTFFPLAPTKNLQPGPGVSSHFRFAKNHFIFLDDRYFRSEKGVTPQTHFGGEQEDWLQRILKKEKGAFWLISGDQFFGGYHTFESYEGIHPQSFKEFLKRLEQRNKIAVFVSGDRHLAEFMKIPRSKLGYPTFELTSSGLHAKTYPGTADKFANPHRAFIKDGEYNFVVVQPLEASKFRFKADAHFYGEGGRPLYHHLMEIQR